jgi:hypothetical protein
MTNNTPPLVARGKVFSVAPMMDGDDKVTKSMACKLSCGQRVQQDKVVCVKIEATDISKLDV